MKNFENLTIADMSVVKGGKICDLRGYCTPDCGCGNEIIIIINDKGVTIEYPA